MEVGDQWQPVLEVARIDERPAAADVKEDRQPRFLGLCPHGEEAGVARRMRLRTGRRHEQRFRPGGNHVSGHRPSPIEIGERYVARRQQPGVDRAEVEHRTVVRARDAVGERGVPLVLGGAEVVVQERVEHELAPEAEQVERPGAVFLDERPHRAPVLPEHDLVLGLRPFRGIRMPPTELIDVGLLTRLDGCDEERCELTADVRVGIGHEPVRGLDHVRVGVVHHAAFGVRHAILHQRPYMGSRCVW